jgi:hypothetical protein
MASIRSPIVSPSSSITRVLASRSGSTQVSAYAARSAGALVSHCATSGRRRIAQVASTSSTVAGRIVRRSVRTGQGTAERSCGMPSMY